MSPWLLTWLANYKRASRSGARPVLLKFHSQNGFEVRRRYSYRWLSRWAAKFSHRYFFPAWRTFRKICRSLGKWCWKIHWKIKKSCLLCRNFISSCKINRTLYGRLGDTNFIFKQFGLLCLVQRHGLMPIIIRGAYLHLVPQGRGLIRNGRLAWRQGAYFFLRDGKMREKALMLISLRIKKTWKQACPWLNSSSEKPSIFETDKNKGFKIKVYCVIRRLNRNRCHSPNFLLYTTGS